MNHLFERRPTNLKRGDWCPVCSQGKFEKICRGFFEEIFQNNFPKKRPNWLVNSRGNQMELDGYNEELGIAYLAGPEVAKNYAELKKRVKGKQDDTESFVP